MDLVLQIVFQIHLVNKYVNWPEQSAVALFVFTHATLSLVSSHRWQEKL